MCRCCQALCQLTPLCDWGVVILLRVKNCSSRQLLKQEAAVATLGVAFEKPSRKKGNTMDILWNWCLGPSSALPKTWQPCCSRALQAENCSALRGIREWESRPLHLISLQNGHLNQLVDSWRDAEGWKISSEISCAVLQGRGAKSSQMSVCKSWPMCPLAGSRREKWRASNIWMKVSFPGCKNVQHRMGRLWAELPEEASSSEFDMFNAKSRKFRTFLSLAVAFAQRSREVHRHLCNASLVCLSVTFCQQIQINCSVTVQPSKLTSCSHVRMPQNRLNASIKKTGSTGSTSVSIFPCPPNCTFRQSLSFNLPWARLISEIPLQAKRLHSKCLSSTVKANCLKPGYHTLGNPWSMASEKVNSTTTVTNIDHLWVHR